MLFRSGVSLVLDLVGLLAAGRGWVLAEFTGDCEEFDESIPIPGRSDGSKIGCVDTDTVPGLIAGESLLFDCPIGLVMRSGISGVPGFSTGFAAGRNNPVGLLISDGNRLSLSGLGAMPDCAALRGKVLRMPGLVF